MKTDLSLKKLIYSKKIFFLPSRYLCQEESLS